MFPSQRASCRGQSKMSPKIGFIQLKRLHRVDFYCAF